ncbi:hypothetical protein ACI2OX_06840 [Bacillus sp. N9]
MTWQTMPLLPYCILHFIKRAITLLLSILHYFSSKEKRSYI